MFTALAFEAPRLSPPAVDVSSPCPAATLMLLAPLRVMLPPLMARPAEPVSTDVNVLAPPTDWAVVRSTQHCEVHPVPPLATDRVPEAKLPLASADTAPAPKAVRRMAPDAVM